jgi:hypothetical protein
MRGFPSIDSTKLQTLNLRAGGTTVRRSCFGEAGKLRSEGPYLELLLSFAYALEAADNRLVVGYAFRDEDVDQIITRWFNGDTQTRRSTSPRRPRSLSIPTCRERGVCTAGLRWERRSRRGPCFGSASHRRRPPSGGRRRFGRRYRQTPRGCQRMPTRSATRSGWPRFGRSPARLRCTGSTRSAPKPRRRSRHSPGWSGQRATKTFLNLL